MKKKRLRRILIVLLCLSVAVAAGAYYISRQNEKEKVILVVNGESVYVNEAMVYWKIMQMEFEEFGGEDLWNVSVLGLDPLQTAIDRTMESIVRVKIAKPIAGQVYMAERGMVEQASQRLRAKLGDEYCALYGISDDLIRKVISENYLAGRYEENAHFRTSDFEKDIQQGLQDRFGIYDEYDPDWYLETYIIQPMMFYTGQWVGDEWISYSDTQKEAILATAKAVLDVSNVRNFRQIAAYFSDDISVGSNPVFHRGAVIHPIDRFGNVYLGQMETSVAEVIQKTNINEMTDIIVTEYGYLVCLVTGKRAATENDLAEYERQLIQEKETYREDLLEALKQQRMDEEWQRLEAESDIIRYRERWSLYVKEHVDSP